MATETELQIEKAEKARKVNEDRNKTRLEMLNSIADGSDTAHADEMQDTADGNIVLKEPENKLEVEKPIEEKPVEVEATKTEEEPVLETEPVVATEEKEEEKDEEVLPTDERVVNGVRQYLTVVNGKDRWFTKNELINRAQKVESADEYLQNAAEAVRKVTRPDLSQEDDTGKVEEEDVDLEKTLSSAVLGDQEAVKKIASTFSELRAELRKAQKTQPSVTPDVVKEIDSRLSFRSAVEWFEGEYSQELADPFLKKLIYDKDQELATADATVPFRERLKKAGDEVRSWIRGQKGVQAKPSLDKLAAKKTLVNVPTASVRQAVTTEDEEEEAPEVTIAKMAQARGQPRAIVHRGPLTK